MREESIIGTEVKRLTVEGMRPAQIARQLGVHVTAVYYHTNPKYKIRGIKLSTERRKSNKKFAIAYKGGKCAKCGYNKCSDALVFHHIDPYQKDILIGGCTLAQETLRKELDKTIMLCAICHIEFHAGQWTPEEILQHKLTFYPAGFVTGKRMLPLSKARPRTKWSNVIVGR